MKTSDLDYERLIRGVRRLRASRDVESLAVALQMEAENWGFSAFCFVTETDTDTFTVPFCTFTDQWKTRYIQRNYGVLDTTVTFMHDNIGPFSWRYDKISADKSPDIRLFWEDAFRHGVGFGVGYTYRGPRSSMVTLTSGDPHLAVEELVLPIRGLIETFRQVYSLLTSQRNGQFDYLSERQRQIIALFCLGYTAEEISKILEISKNTVDRHATEARQRLHASNMPSATSFATFGELVPFGGPDLSHFTRQASFVLDSGRQILAARKQGKASTRNRQK